MVECYLAKVDVGGSSPLSCSKIDGSLAEKQLRLTVDQMSERATVVQVHHDPFNLNKGETYAITLNRRL